jgi:hypothetical protein
MFPRIPRFIDRAKAPGTDFHEEFVALIEQCASFQRTITRYA